MFVYFFKKILPREENNDKEVQEEFLVEQQEAPKFIDSESKKQIVGALSDMLRKSGLTDVFNIYVANKNSSKEKAMQFEEKRMSFLKMRFDKEKEGIIISIVLFTVSFLAYNELIEPCTLGTLLGSIIGYTIGNFNLTKGK